VPDFSEPTVLWRLRRDRSRAHATVFATAETATFAWFFDGTLDRVENYDSLGLALARSEDIKGVLLRDGWEEDR
jgi:hypothetical protein